MNHRIVVVDDSPTLCWVVQRILEREWYVVETYQQPLPAIQALWRQAEDPPTALLLDIGLPQMDGYCVAQVLRTKAPAPLSSIPIIGLSAHDGVLDQMKGRLVKMNAYLVKPFDPDELLHLLETFTSPSPRQAASA